MLARACHVGTFVEFALPDYCRVYLFCRVLVLDKGSVYRVFGVCRVSNELLSAKAETLVNYKVSGSERVGGDRTSMSGQFITTSSSC